MLTATYKLDLVPGGIPLVIPVSQYDVNSRVFSLELTSSGGEVSIPISTSAAIRGTKPDGNGFDYAASGITISGDTVTVSITLTAQMTAVAGRIPCEIYMYTGTPPTTANPDGVNYVQLATANFILQVKPAALDKDTLKSDSEIRQLVDVIDRTDELLDAAADIETAYADYSNKAVFYAEAQTLTDAQKATARENIGAADDDDLAELENTVNVALAGKVDVAQGAAQAGKALVVGEDGNVTTGEAGIPDAVKTALLNLLSHVAYVDGNGQSYYDALSEALGSDWYNTWRWSLSDGQFESYPYTGGFTGSTGYLNINANKESNIRRAMLTKRGQRPYRLNQTDELSDFYAIPVPSNASKVDITVLPATLQTAITIVRQTVEGEVGDYARVLDTGWQSNIGTQYFSASPNKVLDIKCRADANDSTFTTSTEPSEIIVEFGIDDFYDRWRWTLQSGNVSVNQRTSGIDNTNHRLIISSGNEANRRFISVERGVVPFYDSKAAALSTLYPIPVPAAAKKVTVTVTPSTIQGQACVVKRTDDSYASYSWMEWSNFPLVNNFTPSEKLELMIMLRADSSNSNFTSATEPTALTVDFE